MITFIETADCPDCDAIRETLKDMCLAHEVVAAPEKKRSSQDCSGEPHPPTLVDGEEIVQGHENIVRHLDRLRKFLRLWYKYQSDACSCDDEDDSID